MPKRYPIWLTDKAQYDALVAAAKEAGLSLTQYAARLLSTSTPTAAPPPSPTATRPARPATPSRRGSSTPPPSREDYALHSELSRQSRQSSAPPRVIPPRAQPRSSPLNMCSTCPHPRLSHRNSDGPCFFKGCDCMAFKS